MRQRAIGLLTTLFLFVGGAAVAEANGPVGGEVVDADGKGVRGVTIQFTPQDSPDSPITVTTKKKGRFFQRMDGGMYTLSLVDSDQFILSLEYQARDDSGLVLGEGQLNGDPNRGVVGVPISGRNEVELTLTLADKGSEVARQRVLAFAMPELTAAAKSYNSGNYEKAAAEARELIDATPELGEAYYLYGVSLDQLGRLTEADSALTRATEIIPDYEGIWGVLGEVRMKLAVELEEAGSSEANAQLERAAEALTAALERQPDSLPLKMNLAGCLDRLGQTERMIPILEDLLVADPDNLQSRLRLASVYSQMGNADRAMELLQEIPAGETQAAVTLFNVAVRADEDGDRDRALMLAQRAAEIDPKLPHPRQLIAQLLLAKGDMEGAKEAIRVFLELAPDGPEAETYRNILAQLENP